jgi:hypothetical protein
VNRGGPSLKYNERKKTPLSLSGKFVCAFVFELFVGVLCFFGGLFFVLVSKLEASASPNVPLCPPTHLLPFNPSLIECCSWALDRGSCDADHDGD